MKARTLFALIACVAVAAMAPPSAGAKYAKYIRVTPFLNQVDVCRPATDQVQWAYTLKARLDRRNVSRPPFVRMRYEITDLDTGQMVVLQALRLKPKKYYRVGKTAVYAAGHKLQFQLDVSFMSPINGKTLRSRSISTMVAPTVADMDAANAAKPAAPPFPACV